MQLVTKTETSSRPGLPPGVTSIEEVKQLKRPNRTLSKAVSLHLEGKLESAAKLLSKAIESGERDPGLYSALGHIQYEMRDYESAAATYAATGGDRTAPPHRAFQPGRLPRQPQGVEGRRRIRSATPCRPTPRAPKRCWAWAFR